MYIKRLLSIIGLVLFLNLFFFREVGSFGLSVLFLGLYLFLFLVFKDSKSFRRVDLIFFLLISAAGIGLIVRSGGFVYSLIAIFTVILLLCYSYIKAMKIPFIRSMFEILFFPFKLSGIYLSSAVQIFMKTMRNYDSLKHVKVRHRSSISNIFSMGTGIVIGIPVVFVLLVLFYSADPIFASYVKSISEFLSKLLIFNFPKNFGERLLLSSFLFLALLPFLQLYGENKLPGFTQKISTLGLLKEVSIAGLMIGLVVGLFLVVQWSYIFVTVPYETDLSKYHVATFSEYVNRGFWELLIVSCIIYSLIWLFLIVSRNKKTEEKRWLMVTTGVILFEFAIFLASVFRRIYLYQEYHGWSLARIYGGLFLVWLTALTFFLTMRFFSKKRWIYAEFGATCFIVLLICFINFEKFLVFTHPPTVNKNIDYVYLASLSADGISGWEKAYDYVSELYKTHNFMNKENIDQEDRRKIVYSGYIIRQLSENYHYLINKYGSNEDVKNYFNRILPVLALGKQEKTRKAAMLLTADNFHSFVYLAYLPSPLSFENDFSEYNLFYEVMPLEYIKSVKGEKTGQIDKLFSYNHAEHKAYLWFKENQRGDGLFFLQDQFRSLYTKIAGQKEGEREYDQDISFSTPLLD